MALNPFQSLSQGPRQDPYQLPPLPAEEEQGLWSSIGSTALNGLGYLGGALDKPRRALWGLAGGILGQNTWREGLSAIPFSDAMGITDPTQAVYGRDLLGGDENSGFLSQEGLGGLALDILGDPLTYASFGASALSKGGKAAKAAGIALPKGGKARYATTLDDLTKGATQAQKDALAGYATKQGLDLGEVGGQALGGHLGLGLPFMGNSAVFDLSPLGNLASSAIGNTVGKIPGVASTANALMEGVAPIGRSLRGMFDPTVMGQSSVKGQELGKSIYGARQAAKEASLAGDVLPVARAFGQDALSDPQSLRYLAEGQQVPGASQGAKSALPIAQAQQASAKADALAAGVNVNELENYWHRQAIRPELDVARLGGKGRGALSASDTSMIGREEILKNIPGETQTFEKMVKDPFISGKTRKAGLDANAATQHIMKTYGITDQAQAQGLGEFLYSLSPERQNIGFFQKHALTDYEAGVTGIRQATATAQQITEFMAKEASNIKGPGAKSIREVFKEAGLTDTAVNNFYSKMPGMPQNGVLPEMFVPQEVADAITRATKPITTPTLVQPIIQMFDNITNITKGFLTSPFPAFHVRNFTSGAWQNYVLMGLKDMPESYSAAAKALRGDVVPGISKLPYFQGQNLTDAQATQAFSDLVFKHGITGGGAGKDVVGAQAAEDLLTRIPGMMPGRKTGLEAIPEFVKGSVGYGQPGTLGEKLNPLNQRGVAGRTESRFAPIAAGQKLGNEVEDMGRVAAMYGLMKQGQAPEMASAMTKSAHVDYTALSDFEKNVMRRLVPFYAFARGNIPHQLRQIMETPGGKAATAIKATDRARQQSGFTPDYLSSGMAVPVGEEAEGTQRYLTGLGLPFEQAGDVFSGGQLLGQLNPLLKMVGEGLTGRQFHSGRDLRDIHSRLGDLLGADVPHQLENVLMNSPISRAVTTAGTLTDPRKSAADMGLNLLTGARLTDVDQNKARNMALTNFASDNLRGQPGVSRFETLYVRPENLPLLSPEEQAIYRLMRTQEQRNRKARAATQR